MWCVSLCHHSVCLVWWWIAWLCWMKCLSLVSVNREIFSVVVVSENFGIGRPPQVCCAVDRHMKWTIYEAHGQTVLAHLITLLMCSCLVNERATIWLAVGGDVEDRLNMEQAVCWSYSPSHDRKLADISTEDAAEKDIIIQHFHLSKKFHKFASIPSDLSCSWQAYGLIWFIDTV